MGYIRHLMVYVLGCWDIEVYSTTKFDNFVQIRKTREMNFKLAKNKSKKMKVRTGKNFCGVFWNCKYPFPRYYLSRSVYKFNSCKPLLDNEINLLKAQVI